MKDIAIVILNWNGKELLEKFLPNIISYSGNARIIIADNASTDDSILFMEQSFPSVEILRNTENGGFANGYNDALKQVDAKYYLLLNNDVEVSQNWLSPLFEAMKDEKVAGCQPKVLAYNNRDSFEHAGAAGGYIDKNYFPFCRGRIFSDVENDKCQYDSETDVFWTTGACMLIRSELFHKANGFDKDFFAHMEEIDLCWRIKKWGYTFKAISSSSVYHVGGGTLPYSSPRKVYLNFRNNLLMIAKNHEGFWAPKLYYRMLLDSIAAILFLFKGQFKSFAAVVKAHMYVHTHLRQTLKKRKEIKAGVTSTNQAGMYRGSILWDFFLRKVKKFSMLNRRLFN